MQRYNNTEYLQTEDILFTSYKSFLKKKLKHQLLFLVDLDYWLFEKITLNLQLKYTSKYNGIQNESFSHINNYSINFNGDDISSFKNSLNECYDNFLSRIVNIMK